MRPIPRRLAWALGLLVAVPVAVGLAFDSNWLRSPIENAVSKRTGRAFDIRGELDIVPRWPLRVVIEDVRFANPPWAKEPNTLELERAEVAIALLPLLRGRVELPEVVLTKPVIALEKSPDGRNDNWTLAKQDGPEADQKEGRAPVIGRLAVDQGVLLFHDPANRTALKLEVQTQAETVRFRAGGTYRGQRVDAEGHGGSILSIADTTAPYALGARFKVGATQGTASGSIVGLAALAAADLILDVGGESLSELYALIGVALPPTPPYRIKGHLVREGDTWRFHDFDGRVGDSDLSGDADVALAGPRPRLVATLESQLLDLDDLGGFIGATPEAGAGETASPRQQQQRAAREASPKLLPDVPLKLDRLRAMDADVRFTGKSIRGKAPIDDLTTHLVLEGGLLTLKPLNFGVAGGNVVSMLALDGRGEVAAVDADFEFRRIDLKKLFPGNQTVARATGLVGGRAKLKGSGNSLADVLAGADGELGLAMVGGRVSNLVLELAGLDAAEALGLLFRGDRQVALRCAVADMGLQDGILGARSFVIDTTDTNINVRGTTNLRTEELDLTLDPLPKDYSLVALRTPLHVRGTFKDLKIRPDETLVLKGGVAAILGALAGPLASLVALVERGPGENADCGRLVAAVERHTGAQPEPAAGSP